MDAELGAEVASGHCGADLINDAYRAKIDQDAREMKQLRDLNYELSRRIWSLETRMSRHDLQQKGFQWGGPLSSYMAEVHMYGWIDANPWFDPCGDDKDSQLVRQAERQLLQEGQDPGQDSYWTELTRRVELMISQNDAAALGPDWINDIFQPDHQSDLIGAKLARVQALTRWSGEKHRLMNDVRRMLKAYNYQPVRTNPSSYPVRRVGQSCLYQVPENKRGLFSPYRGQLVRLVCVGNSSPGTIDLMAGRAAGS